MELPKFVQDGLKPIQVAAARGNRAAVDLLLPVTSQVQGVSEWNVDGLIEYMQSQTEKAQVFFFFQFLFGNLILLPFLFSVCF